MAQSESRGLSVAFDLVSWNSPLAAAMAAPLSSLGLWMLDWMKLPPRAAKNSCCVVDGCSPRKIRHTAIMKAASRVPAW
eukprot:scaffold537_cov241-Pinguiococcus_pyrenoidosus.AAC.20